MSHYAKIENNKVVQVIVAEEDFIVTQKGTWVQTSYNTIGNTHTLGGTPLRGNYASIGHTYDEDNDVFYAPKAFASWTLNTSTWLWEAPITKPTDGVGLHWD